LIRRPGEGRQQRRDTKQQQADHEHALAADPVTDNPEGEQQAREDQGVGVDRPLELALAGTQARVRLGDRLQRDVEDGVVEHDGEKADDEDAEDAPASTENRLCVHGAFREVT
jgi:hypothetical protein